MGQLLSHPIEEKSLESCNHASVSYTVGSMQGYRMTMEDAHNVKINDAETVQVYGVFDGHGGKEVAENVSDTLVAEVFTRVNSMRGAALSQYMGAIKDAFFEADSALAPQMAAHCGSTAVVAVVLPQYIVVANTGDSRAILSLPGGTAKTLSFDHKPSNMGERVRIENSGGYVVNGRVNEILALSRALGDLQFKVPYVELAGCNNVYAAQNRKYFTHGLIALPPELFQVTAEPELLVYDVAALAVPEFMVLACDGIWDCYRNDELVKSIRDKLALGWNLQHITEFVLNDCIAMASKITGIGFDNMTIIIVAFHAGKTMDEWYETMRARVLAEKGLG